MGNIGIGLKEFSPFNEHYFAFSCREMYLGVRLFVPNQISKTFEVVAVLENSVDQPGCFEVCFRSWVAFRDFLQHKMGITLDAGVEQVLYPGFPRGVDDVAMLAYPVSKCYAGNQ